MKARHQGLYPGVLASIHQGTPGVPEEVPRIGFQLSRDWFLTVTGQIRAVLRQKIMIEAIPRASERAKRRGDGVDFFVLHISTKIVELSFYLRQKQTILDRWMHCSFN